MSRESARAWKLANPEKAKANHKKWRDANKERIKQYGEQYKAKDPEKFRMKANARTDKWRELNRERYLEQSKARYQANADERRAKRKAYYQKYYAEKGHLWLEYGRKKRGLPSADRPCPEDSLCEACGGPPNGQGKLHLDHCHVSGKFRGWLCHKCNNGFGLLGDTLIEIERRIEYLRRYG